MGWAVGYDDDWKRDIGYGVPASCDHPSCERVIDRGLAHVCGGEPYGGEHGCGLYFCGSHLWYSPARKVPLCERCLQGLEPWDAKPDLQEWIDHKETDPSWEEWRRKRDEG